MALPSTHSNSDIPDVVNPPNVTVCSNPKKPARGFMWLKAAAISALFGSSPVRKRREPVKIPPLEVDEYRFGKAPSSLQEPLLRVRRGKGTRKQRRAARASERARFYAYSILASRPSKTERRRMSGHKNSSLYCTEGADS